VAREDPTGTARDDIDRSGARGLVDRTKDGPICLRTDEIPDENR
jgi:hypothetical protein